MIEPEKVLMDVTNIGEGEFAAELQEHYKGVLSKLRAGEKGAISITLTISRMKDAITMATVEYSIVSKTPKRKRGSIAQIVGDENGEMALKVDAPKPSNVRQLKILEEVK
jgi:hypothetical protein